MAFGELNPRDLDRYITGNYGEDQFRGEEELERMVDETCGVCPHEGRCDWEPDEGFEKWEKCPRVKYYINTKNDETARVEEAYERWHREMLIYEGICPECGERLSCGINLEHKVDVKLCVGCALTFPVEEG